MADNQAGSFTSDAAGVDVKDSPVDKHHLAYLEVQKVPAGSTPMVTGRQSDSLSNKGMFEDKKTCILLRNIGEAPHTDALKYKLKVLLDPPRQFGGDIRSLADSFGYTNSEINYLTSIKGESPTEVLLHDKSDCVIKELIKKLNKIGRDDAVRKVNEYIKSQKCGCEDCRSLC